MRARNERRQIFHGAALVRVLQEHPVYAWRELHLVHRQDLQLDSQRFSAGPQDFQRLRKTAVVQETSALNWPGHMICAKSVIVPRPPRLIERDDSPPPSRQSATIVGSEQRLEPACAIRPDRVYGGYRPILGTSAATRGERVV